MYCAKGPFDLELNPVIDLFQLDDRSFDYASNCNWFKLTLINHSEFRFPIPHVTSTVIQTKEHVNCAANPSTWLGQPMRTSEWGRLRCPTTVNISVRWPFAWVRWVLLLISQNIIDCIFSLNSGQVQVAGSVSRFAVVMVLIQLLSIRSRQVSRCVTHFFLFFKGVVAF